MFTITLSSSRHFSIDIHTDTVFNAITLAWPLILQWRRESAKHPDRTEVSVWCDRSRTGMGHDIKLIKRDRLVDWMMEVTRRA
jgi:hypothetical protein